MKRCEKIEIKSAARFGKIDIVSVIINGTKCTVFIPFDTTLSGAYTPSPDELILVPVDLTEDEKSQLVEAYEFWLNTEDGFAMQAAFLNDKLLGS